MKKLNRQERSYFAKLLRNIVLNAKSIFYEDEVLIKQWIKLQKMSGKMSEKGQRKCPKQNSSK